MYNAIDLFAGCGGMTEGLIESGFDVVAAIEVDKYAAAVYEINHLNTKVFQEDIRCFDIKKINVLLNGKPLHLLAGCPPCQGFSVLSCKNQKKAKYDERNNLILEYLRFVEELKPLNIMLENVPGIESYFLFKHVVNRLNELGYNPKYKIVDVASYGVPQRRKRLVLVGSLIGNIPIPEGENKIKTVRDYIGNMESVQTTIDNAHKRYPNHSDWIKKKISLIPIDGGSQKDLPTEYILNCHKKENVGYSDVYGRLRWDSVSSTITGGCLNPSKGRFLHPEEHRCITAREASLLQTFRNDYIFPDSIPLTNLALMIGNALPPLFCKIQCMPIKVLLDSYYPE